MTSGTYSAQMRTEEKIYARKLMAVYAKPFGVLAEHALSDLTAYNTFFDEKQLDTYLSDGIRRILTPSDKLKLTPGGVNRTGMYIASQIRQEMAAHPELCPSVVRDGKRLFTSPDLVQAEQDIVEAAKRMSLRKVPYFRADQDLTDIADDFSVFWNSAQGFSRSKDLDKAMASILEPGDLRLINGPPGAGKSGLCAGLAYCMLAHMDTPPTFITTAPSDKAAAAIHADVQFAASALDDKWPEQSQVQGMPLKDLINRMNEGFVEPGTVIIVDEAGLMGTREMAQFITAADKTHAKLFMLGDNRQIPPLPAGNGFDLIINHVPEASIYNVTRILRQRTPGEAKASSWIREGHAEKALDFYAMQRYPDGSKALRFHDDAKSVYDSLTKDYVEFVTSSDTQSMSSVVLAIDERSAQTLNDELREGLKKAGVIRKARDVYGEGDTVTELGLGDAVMFTGKVAGNDGRNTETVNPGTTARVVDIRGDRLGLMLDGKKKRIYIPEEKSSILRYSWALPLYVAQGVSRDRAFFAIDRSGGLDLAKGLVGFTRHTEQLSAYISREAYPSHKELAKEMSVFSSREPVIKDYADLKPAERKGSGLAQSIAASFASSDRER